MKIKSIRNIKIKTKLLFLGAVSIFGLLVLGSESVATAWKISQVGKEISQTWMPAVITAENLNSLTSDYRIKENYHVIAADPTMMREFEEELLSLREVIDQRFQEYRRYQTTAEDQDMIRMAEGLWRQYLEESEALMETSKTNDRGHALELILGESEELFDEANNLFLKASEHTQKEAERASRFSEHLYARLSTIKIFVIALVSLIVITLVFYLIRAVEKPVEALADAARRATNGNLDIHLEYRAEDEIGILTAAMNVLVDRLKDIIEDEKYLFREIGNKNFDVKSNCEKAYRGDFAPILYSFTSLQNRLKEMKCSQEEELKAEQAKGAAEVKKLQDKIERIEQKQEINIEGKGTNEKESNLDASNKKSRL